jgi:hypothetical protein
MNIEAASMTIRAVMPRVAACYLIASYWWSYHMLLEHMPLLQVFMRIDHYLFSANISAIMRLCLLHTYSDVVVPA